MKEVTQQEFYEAIGPLNVHPRPEGNYPYTSVFEDQRTRQTVGIVQNGATGQPSRYFLRRGDRA